MSSPRWLRAAIREKVAETDETVIEDKADDDEADEVPRATAQIAEPLDHNAKK